MQVDPTSMKDKVYKEIKILESRLDQIICLLETITRTSEKEKLNIEGDTRCQMINLG